MEAIKPQLEATGVQLCYTKSGSTSCLDYTIPRMVPERSQAQRTTRVGGDLGTGPSPVIELPKLAGVCDVLSFIKTQQKMTLSITFHGREGARQNAKTWVVQLPGPCLLYRLFLA